MIRPKMRETTLEHFIFQGFLLFSRAIKTLKLHLHDKISRITTTISGKCRLTGKIKTKPEL
jgi:hypothetical protein